MGKAGDKAGEGRRFHARAERARSLARARGFIPRRVTARLKIQRNPEPERCFVGTITKDRCFLLYEVIGSFPRVEISGENCVFSLSLRRNCLIIYQAQRSGFDRARFSSVHRAVVIFYHYRDGITV